jgi:hypothetical protein
MLHEDAPFASCMRIPAIVLCLRNDKPDANYTHLGARLNILVTPPEVVMSIFYVISPTFKTKLSLIMAKSNKNRNKNGN